MLSAEEADLGISPVGSIMQSNIMVILSAISGLGKFVYKSHFANAPMFLEGDPKTRFRRDTNKMLIYSIWSLCQKK